MPAPKTGESKQALVITLVMFVLLSIVLGVVAYYGYADQARLMDEQKKAVADKDGMKKSRDWEQFKAQLLKVYCGLGSKDDVEALAQLRSQYDGGSLGGGEKDKADIDAMVKKLDDPNTLGWDQNLKKPAHTYTERMTTLNSEIAKAYLDRDKFQTATKNKEEELQGLIAANEAALKKAKDDLAQAHAKNKQIEANKSKEYLESLARVEALDKENEDLKKKVSDVQDEMAKAMKKAQINIQDLEIKNQITQDKLPVRNVLDYDTPKGEIVNLDRSGKVAFINLGSADNVHPRLTFSIVGSAAGGNSKRQPKGSLEIADVTGPHLSTARITEVVDPNRNPIVSHDKLYNPGWNPNLREHVAIAGLIDLTGDGRDNTPEFIQNLQKQGMVVDAYLDLKDLTIKGRGINFQTNYLILGQIPEFTASQQLKEGDRGVERKKDIQTKVSEMQVEAKRFGTEVIPYRRFLGLIGYRLPRAALQSTEPDFNLYRGTQTAPKEEKPAEPTEPAKEK